MIGTKGRVLLGWLLSALCVVGSTVWLVNWLLNQTLTPTVALYGEAFGFSWSIPVFYSLMGALIISRKPHNRLGWLLILTAMTAMPYPNIESYMTVPPVALTPGLWLLFWFEGWSWIPLIFPVFLIPLHFPTGYPPSPKWRWINWMAIVMWLIFIVVLALLEVTGPTSEEWFLPNPIGFIPLEFVNGSFLILWSVGLVTVLLASVLSLIVRFRRARTKERQQLKWLLYVGSIFLIVYMAQSITATIETTDSINRWVDSLFIPTILAFPVAIAIAILRHQLFDIDVIIRKTAVYAVLSLLLATVYFGTVILLQTLFERVTQETSPLIIVVSTLFIAALFSPLRQRVQALIDRRFFRKKYDAQQVLARFAVSARDELSLEALTAELVDVVQETIQPDGVDIWLRR